MALKISKVSSSRMVTIPSGWGGKNQSGKKPDRKTQAF
jgi:hypothetical protein